MLTAVIFIIVLAILIFVHELGHFLAARASGIRVDAFKLGFGPKIFAWKRGETEYGINLIPFGGYVKIHGENPDEESVSGPDAARSFVNKPRWKQVVVLVAGVTFNFIFAWVLYVLGFTFGMTTDNFERYNDDIVNKRVMVVYVAENSPASKAGFEVGDVITDIFKPASVSSSDEFNTSTSSRIASTGGLISAEDIPRFVNDSKGKTLQFTIVKDEVEKVIEIKPVEGIVDGKYAIGINPALVGDVHLPFFHAIWEGFHYTLVMIRETAIGLGSFVGNIFQGTAKLSDVSGPVGIAGIVGTAADLGFTYLIMITALISINLGVINLVPFPALDGGRVLFVLIEAVIRRRIPMKFTNWVNGIGFALLMLLMLVVTYRDIAKIFK
jgi:regulator of sigma E protease